MVWKPGQPLFGGRYIIESKLGEGGIGITYLARNQRNELRVIKTLKEEILNHPVWKQHRDKLRQDFRNEAVHLAVCRHPHVVEVETIFDEGKFPCMVMEYVEGEDLGKRLLRMRLLSEAEALLYIRQIGDALTVIHNKGLLHRDLKPRNIMLRSGKSEAVLIDFGIARDFIPNVIQKHTVYRTPGFAPPEQYDLVAPRGEFIDIYALAATLYNLLTGVLPTSAEDRRNNILLQQPQHFNRNISDRVNQAIMQGMDLQANYRPQSVQEWLNLLAVDVGSDVPSTVKISSPQIPKPAVVAPLEWQCLHTLKGHTSMVQAIAISPDGQLIASGSNDNNIKLWQLTTGKLLRDFNRWFSGHSSMVDSLAFSPDGQLLASGSWDDTIKLWQVNTGKQISTFTGHSSWVNSVAFSPDGQFLASGSGDNTVKLWQVSTNKELCTLTGHSDSVWSVAFSQDGQLLASASWDKTIKIWHASTAREICTLSGHLNYVRSVAFSPDGRTLVSGSDDDTIKIWRRK